MTTGPTPPPSDLDRLLVEANNGVELPDPCVKPDCRLHGSVHWHNVFAEIPPPCGFGWDSGNDHIHYCGGQVQGHDGLHGCTVCGIIFLMRVKGVLDL